MKRYMKTEVKMKRKLLFTILTMFIFSLSITFAVGAAEVPWLTETYNVSTWAAAVDQSINDSDFAVGPPLPISAYSWVGVSDGYDLNWGSATAEITDTTMYLSLNFRHDGHNDGYASFNGNYTAIDPYFVYSYNLLSSGYQTSFNIGVWDLTTSTSLYSLDIRNGSDVLYIPTTVGNDIRVTFSLDTDAYNTRHIGTSTLTYSMSTAVAPEPVSMVLFVTGGALLAGRRLLKRRRS